MTAGTDAAKDQPRAIPWMPSSGALLEATLTEVIDAALAVSTADFGKIQLLDPRTMDLRIAAHRGLPDWWLKLWNDFSVGRGARGTALELRKRVVIEDLEGSSIFWDPAARDIQRKAGVRAVQSTPLLTRSGRPIGVFSTHYRSPYRPDARALHVLDLLARHASDLVERALADEALAKSEDKYAAIFRLSPLAIALTTTSEGTLVDVNDAFLALFDLTREQSIGRTGVDLGTFDRDSRERVSAELHARGSVHDFECVWVNRSGARRVVALYVNRVVMAGVEHVLTEAVDVTTRYESAIRQRELMAQLEELNRDLERRVAERTAELVSAREAAEAASKAKSEFLSSMSHEMRTPLNSILGFAELIHRDKKAPLNGSQLDKIERVLKSGERLLHLVDDVLDLSRIEADRLTVSPEPVQLADALAEVSATLEPMASRLQLELVIEPPPPDASWVVADRARLAQVLINYGSNALKFGKEKGRATISSAALDNGFVRITVTDDGIGIPEAEQAKIFEPFERAGQETGPVEGTGIGLTIAKRLAELMGGSVGFRSVAGQGSAFWIDLPAPSSRAHSSILDSR